MSNKIIVGGVPEHFNAPFHLGLASDKFLQQGVEMKFVDCLGGTGEMTTKLNNGELDVAVALTEGLIAAIAKGEAKFKIVAEYTTSPLIWGISTSPNSEVKTVSDLEGKTFGISRFGSGSQIMAIVLAKNNGFKAENHWRVLRNFQGLRDGVNSGEADAFLWEKFTTKPFHDSREIAKIGEIVTPWPAFMIAVSDAALAKFQPETLLALFKGIQESCVDFKQNTDNKSVDYVVEHYGNTPEDAARWFSGVSYSKDGSISRAMLEKVVDVLKEAEVLQRDLEVNVDSIIHKDLALLVD